MKISMRRLLIQTLVVLFWLVWAFGVEYSHTHSFLLKAISIYPVAS